MFRRSQHQNISLRGLPEKDRLALRDSLQAPVGPAAPACPGDAANLVDMTALAYGEKFEGMYPSVGACDEFIRLFPFQKSHVPQPQQGLDSACGGYGPRPAATRAVVRDWTGLSATSQLWKEG